MASAETPTHKEPKHDERMEDDDPAVAAGLHRYMAVLIAERLMFTTRTLNAVMI